MSNTCIRALADPVQIKECKESLHQLNPQLSEISNVYNLVGNLARLKILFLLHKEDEMCPCDLSDVLEISVAGVSQHLRKLKDGGLIIDKKVGQTVFYSLINENVGLILTMLNELINEPKIVKAL